MSLAIGMLLGVATNASADEAPVTVLKAAHLFDSVSGKLTDNGILVVQGDKILAVGA